MAGNREDEKGKKEREAKRQKEREKERATRNRGMSKVQHTVEREKMGKMEGEESSRRL